MTAHNSILVQRGRVGDGNLLAGIGLLLALKSFMATVSVLSETVGVVTV